MPARRRHNFAPRRPGASWVIAAAAWAAAVAVVPGLAPTARAAEPPPAPAAADDRDAPVVLNRRERTDWLHLDPAKFTLELRVQYQRDSLAQGGANDQASSTSIEETLTAETTGYIVHPNLVELDLSATVGLAQRFFDGTSADTRLNQEQNDLLYAWDAHALVVRKESNPLTLYTQRTQQNVSRSFGPTLESTSTTYGATWDFKSNTTPTRLNVYHREQDQQGAFDGASLLTEASAFNLKQDTVEWGGQHRFTEHQSVAWSYAFNSVRQSGADFGGNSFQSHDASASYSAEFGPRFAHTFNSTLEYLSQSGDFAQERLRFDNQLHFRHTDRFETDYNYTYTDDSIFGQKQTSHRATAGFRHRLFDSLITTGQVGLVRQDAEDGGSSTDYFANVSWTYAKKVPMGTFGADLALSFDHSENTTRTVPLLVADEAHAFTDPVGVILNRRSIDPKSIRITGPDGLVLFRPDLDFLVVPFGDRTEIRRIPTGLIPDGSSVLIDYAVDPEPANTITTTGFATGVRYTFETGPLTGLSPYARYFRQSQQITSDQPDFFIPNDLTEITVGADYRLGELQLSLDHVWHDSAVDPYEATHTSARYLRRIGADLTLSGTLTYSMIEYHEPLDSTVNLLTAAAEANYRISRDLRAKATLLWRDEDDSQLGHTRGLEETLEVRWKHRQTEVYLLLRNSNYETDTQDRGFQFLQVGIRREF